MLIAPLGLGLIGAAFHVVPPVMSPDPTEPSIALANLGLVGTIAFLGLAYVLWARCKTWRGATLTGLLIGLGFYGLSLHWLGESVVADPETYSVRAGLTALGGWTLLYPWWALAFGAAHAFARLASVPLTSTAGALLFAVALSVSDILLGDLVLGIPLAPVSSALLDTPWQPILTAGGTHGANAALGLAGALLGAFAMRTTLRSSLALLVAVGGLCTATAVGSVTIGDDPDVHRPHVQVYLAQPDAPSAFELRHDEDPQGTLVRGLLDAVEAGRGADLVVLPETASPLDLATEPELVAELASRLDPGAILVVGFRRSVAGAETDGSFAVRTFNTASMIASSGEVVASYDKAHLVPFGEHMPQLFHDMGFDVVAGSGLSLDAGPSLDVFRLDGIAPFALLICYEALLSGPVSRETDGARWLLNVSDEGLFGRTIGPRLLLRYARMRSAETGMPMLRSADTGYTAVIEGDGRVDEVLGPNQSGGVTTSAALVGSSPPTTVFRKLGYGPLYVSWAVLLIAIGIRGWTRGRLVGGKLGPGRA